MSTKQRGKNGGARPGSGRKKGGKNRSTLLRENAEDAYINAFLLDFNEIIETKRALALGDYFVQKGNKVYKALPDNKALEEILDRISGKPKMRIENEGSMNINSPALEKLAEAIQNILKK